MLSQLHVLEERDDIIEWIYGHQMRGGFRGGTRPHLAMTYSALATLVTLGDDLKRVDVASITEELDALRGPDGSVAASSEEGQRDVRFSFCAVAISEILSLRRDHELAQFVLSCQSYDGGFGLSPGAESHGGSTFCAVATLALLRTQPPSSVLDWCARRFTPSGFVGRVNKPPDSCYAFWIGATLTTLRLPHDPAPITNFLATCEHSLLGGFAKYPHARPDLLHTFYSIAFLSCHDPTLNPIHPILAICRNRLPPHIRDLPS